MTGLPRYDAFVHELEGRMTLAEKSGEAVAMGLIDLDFFGRINAKHGRETGDACLCLLADALTQACPAGGQVFRYGGDAFALLLAVEKEQAFLLLEGIRSDFARPHRVQASEGSLELDLSVSVGIAAYPDDGAQAPDVIRKTNEALYRAKLGGRNKACLAREERMVTKTSHYTVGQLEGLSRLAKREGLGEAALLREAVDDLLRKYNS